MANRKLTNRLPTSLAERGDPRRRRPCHRIIEPSPARRCHCDGTDLLVQLAGGIRSTRCHLWGYKSRSRPVVSVSVHNFASKIVLAQPENDCIGVRGVFSWAQLHAGRWYASLRRTTCPRHTPLAVLTSATFPPRAADVPHDLSCDAATQLEVLIWIGLPPSPSDKAEIVLHDELTCADLPRWKVRLRVFANDN